MHATLSADCARSLAADGLVTADDTVSSLFRVLRIVLLGQRISCIGLSARPVWLLIGRQLLQQLVHELLAEAQLPAMLLPFRLELEGVDDAHVEQPPGQTRPAALGFATR